MAFVAPAPSSSGAVMWKASFDAPYPATRARTVAPRACACSAASRITTPAPSPITNPSRRASKGHERPCRDSAPMRRKAARQMSVIAASVPPATTASASPRAIMRAASPIAWPPVAHAEATEKPGPWAP